ncbi:MAG TPA: family 16 glycoside hydrolase, partial [Opitutaceae bacterium]
TRGVLIRMEEDVLALDPAAVVLLIGTNDLEEGATPEIIAANLGLIVAGLLEHDPDMSIVLCQVFPSSARMRRPADQIKSVNAACLDAVKNNPRITVLETWTLFADANGDAIVEEFPDLLHPNESGYAKWAAALRPIFATFGLSEKTTDPFTAEPGFVSLFNGKDLTGWGYRATPQAEIDAAKQRDASSARPPVRVFFDHATDFDSLTATPDGRYAAQSGRLTVTTPPEQRKIQQLWTTREFPKDFVLKLEFRATPNADSGIYLRGPQLQCRDYLVAGPYKDLKHYRPQDWNEIVVTVRGDVAVCTCNGEVLESEFKISATGPIGLEGDRGQVEYRRIRIRELP